MIEIPDHVKHESSPGKIIAVKDWRVSTGPRRKKGRPSLIFFGGSVGSWDVWLGRN